MVEASFTNLSSAEIADGVARAKIYDRQWKDLGDFIRYNPGACHRRRLIHGFLRGMKFQSMLDVGCGPGEMLLGLARKLPTTTTLVGADFASEVVAKNRRSMPGLRFETLDIEQECLPEQFDLVLCSEVLEHLHDRKQAFENLACMVKPRGHLLVTCPTGHVYATERHFGHTSHPSTDEIQSLSAANGLHVDRLINWGWPTYDLLKIGVNLNPEFAIRKFGGGQYSVFSKILNRLLYLATFLSLPNCRYGCQLACLMSKIP